MAPPDGAPATPPPAPPLPAVAAAESFSTGTRRTRRCAHSSATASPPPPASSCLAAATPYGVSILHLGMGKAGQRKDIDTSFTTGDLDHGVKASMDNALNVFNEIGTRGDLSAPQQWHYSEGSESARHNEIFSDCEGYHGRSLNCWLPADYRATCYIVHAVSHMHSLVSVLRSTDHSVATYLVICFTTYKFKVQNCNRLSKRSINMLISPLKRGINMPISPLKRGTNIQYSLLSGPTHLLRVLIYFVCNHIQLAAICENSLLSGPTCLGFMVSEKKAICQSSTLFGEAIQSQMFECLPKKNVVPGLICICQNYEEHNSVK